jgi:pyruvate,water dikinase
MIPLTDPDARRPEIAGRKAAMLAAMKHAGFLVPEGFIVPDGSALRDGLAVLDGLALEDGFAVRDGLGLRDGLAIRDGLALRDGEVAAVWAVVASSPPDTRWAVRSSAIAEDLPGASFAGVYESFVNLNGADDIIAAIERVRASAHGQRAAHYRSPLGEHRDAHADAPGAASGVGPVNPDEHDGRPVPVQHSVEVDACGVALALDADAVIGGERRGTPVPVQHPVDDDATSVAPDADAVSGGERRGTRLQHAV